MVATLLRERERKGQNVGEVYDNRLGGRGWTKGDIKGEMDAEI